MTRFDKVAASFFTCLGITLLGFTFLVVPNNAFASNGSDCASSCSGLSGQAYYDCVGQCCASACGSDDVCAGACCGDACGLDGACFNSCMAAQVDCGLGRFFCENKTTEPMCNILPQCYMEETKCRCKWNMSATPKCNCRPAGL